MGNKIDTALTIYIYIEICTQKSHFSRLQHSIMIIYVSTYVLIYRCVCTYMLVFMFMRICVYVNTFYYECKHKIQIYMQKYLFIYTLLIYREKSIEGLIGCDSKYQTESHRIHNVQMHFLIYEVISHHNNSNNSVIAYIFI